MNKKELVAAVAAKTEMTQVSVEKALKAIIEATTGKNPQNGKPIKIAAATVPAFKAGKAFKEAVNAKPAKKKAAKKGKK